MEERETIASMLLDQLERVPEWMNQGACVDASLDPLDPHHAEAFIREVCGKCPVIQQCRSHFEDSSEDLNGVFYGEEM